MTDSQCVRAAETESLDILRLATFIDTENLSSKVFRSYLRLALKSPEKSPESNSSVVLNNSSVNPHAFLDVVVINDVVN